MTSRIEKLDLRTLDIVDLVGVTSLRLEVLADRLIFKPLHLTAASFRILTVLKRFKEMTPTEIIGYLGGTKSNITQRLYHLNRSGLVKMYRPENGDRRKVLVSLTTQGEKSLRRVMTGFGRNNFKVENYFSARELKNFSNFLIKLNKGIDACENNLFKI